MVKIYNCTKEQIDKTLELTNRIFDDNIKYNRFEKKSKNCFAVTLRVKNSSKKGTLLGHTGRRTSSACWHVWGTFFQTLFNINNKARIRTAMPTIRDILTVYDIWKKQHPNPMNGYPAYHNRCLCVSCEYGYIDQVNKLFETPISQ